MSWHLDHTIRSGAVTRITISLDETALPITVLTPPASVTAVFLLIFYASPLVYEMRPIRRRRLISCGRAPEYIGPLRSRCVIGIRLHAATLLRSCSEGFFKIGKGLDGCQVDCTFRGRNNRRDYSMNSADVSGVECGQKSFCNKAWS